MHRSRDANSGAPNVHGAGGAENLKQAHCVDVEHFWSEAFEQDPVHIGGAGAAPLGSALSRVRVF